ncbi:MAG: cation:proton antiporter [Gammaproteobacteria bacterium]|uniref:cation:proton antiporter n=1 Tax=Rhodoferax sp. TaxID=50421 RepID=UPI0017F98D85|nr:cation:proton antiporter [Rhodoferax sp.]MBU3897797.1 cation:proton antiporter [Gammaproteobacteria bacterium]MBA3056525.1 sodium:proton antiporter [Rhodoferax sp.]MBU3997256.1 cation:proton antiporter [Gammaproteobacteria bacterium]MBU4017872.1 cation:proton antiporter [Gammaproteobacteria bacterium]MBU4078673.1 cation:proton antiporter [Gammaproteobacteria bacterium]
MTNAQWFVLIGGLLLVRGLTPSVLKRSPFTAAMIYLAVGLLVGPSVLNLFHFNPLKESALLEVLTEVAVLISLFSAGVKMPVPFSFSHWRAPILLATVSMSITVALVAAFAYYVLGLPLGAGVLLGAIVAPTDPVLATDVQSRHPGDRDQLRFTLTCEAGMNDGSAFPFVMLGLGLLGLHELGDTNLRWALVDVLWATVGGIAVGIVAGVLLARLGWKLRRVPHQHELMDDFLGLGLIGLVYGVSVMINAWGFLAVFAAAVALRQTELKLARAAQQASSAQQASTALSTATAQMDPSSLDSAPESAPMVSQGSLVFKEHLERLSEVMLVLLVGGSLFLNSWSWAAVGLALFVFLVARPVSVFLGLLGTRTTWRIRGMVGWFGVRGIGSLYYLMYAIQHGLPEALALELIQLTLIVVTLSILLHGISVKPLMAHFWKRKTPSMMAPEGGAKGDG